MVLDYIPCDKYNFFELFDEYAELKCIDDAKKHELLFDTLDCRFCKYILKRGANKGSLCMRKFSKNKNKDVIYCCEHRYQEKLCTIDNCNRKCKKTYDICNYHFKSKNKYKTTIEENVEEIIYKYGPLINLYDNYKLDIYNIKINELKISHEKTWEKNNLFYNKNIIKYFNLKNYITNKYNIKMLDSIVDIAHKYGVPIIFIINLITWFFMAYKTNGNVNNIISLYDLNSINCTTLMQYMGYHCVSDGKRFRFECNKFNIVITDNIMFFDNKKRIGNIGAINLYKYITNKTMKDSINDLKKIYVTLKNDIKLFDSLQNNGNTKEKHEKINNNPVPKKYEKNINNVKNYLINYRKLDKNIINNLIKKKLISADIYNNCIFYNDDKTTAFLRSSNPNIRFFKATGIMDFIVYTFGNGPLYIFESPIDCISYYQMYKQTGTYISTNGATLVNIDKITKKIEQYNPNNITYLCFDNDKAGNNFTKKLMDNIDKKFERIIPQNKDWNDDLRKKKL